MNKLIPDVIPAKAGIQNPLNVPDPRFASFVALRRTYHGNDEQITFKQIPDMIINEYHSLLFMILCRLLQMPAKERAH